MVQMKRILLVTVLLLSSSFLFSQDLILTESETNWLLDHPVIRLGVGTNYPPIQYVTEKNGEYVFQGIASDYVELLAELLGVDFDIAYGITFREAMEKAENREIDMFPCITFTSSRGEFLDFTEGYIKNPIVIFSNDDTPFIHSINDLSGLKVSDVEALYIYNQLKADVPGINFVLAENAEVCLENVAFGRADANVAGLISGSYMIRKNNWANIKVAAPAPYPDTVFRMAVRDDWPELTAILEKALASIEQEQRSAIEQKWLAVRFEHGISRAYVIRRLHLVVGIAAVIVFIVLMWALRLRGEIARRKEVEASLDEREIQLKGLLQNKEVLMREIEHRVKNNLTLVASLVNLQAAKLSNQEDVEKMKLVIDRIYSIVVLHEKLSLSSDLKNINIEGYINELVSGIIRTRSDGSSDVEIRCDIVNTVFDAGSIIVIGLIVTELLTNALKYGFKNRESGLIEIILKEDSRPNYILTVRNNGIPLPEGLDFTAPNSLGINLVMKLVKQLNGEMVITHEPSPVFELSFSINEN
ncbi:MAG TPA: hypothetical protein DCO79_14740 [Spirochaeta sp.]|nr:hypothetical protein [Spirochaeta sp.]